QVGLHRLHSPLEENSTRHRLNDPQSLNSLDRSTAGGGGNFVTTTPAPRGGRGGATRDNIRDELMGTQQLGASTGTSLLQSAKSQRDPPDTLLRSADTAVLYNVNTRRPSLDGNFELPSDPLERLLQELRTEQ
ncbi:unnamed protein product, partial [Amoebophrya sp. A25]